MKEFTIPEEFMTDITIHKKWNTYTQNGRVPTPAELLLLLEGKGECSVISSADHPEFAKLRDKLEAGKFIRTCRNSWNGDRVTKTFRLNGFTFEKDAQFPSGAAIKSHIKFRMKIG
jgi:hypothetical protein